MAPPGADPGADGVPHIGACWPGEDPIGKRILLGPPDAPGEWHDVVGVVGETRYPELADPQPSLYLPIRQFGGPVPTTLAVRTGSEPAGAVPQIRRVLQEIHPEWVLSGGGSMRELMAAPLARPRFSTFLLGAFAAFTVLLSAVGLYGVLSLTVRQRTREIGIQLAIGASADEVARRVVRQGMVLVAAGILLGVAGALATSHLLRTLLFRVSPTDPLTLAAASALLLAVALLPAGCPRGGRPERTRWWRYVGSRRGGVSERKCASDHAEQIHAGLQRLGSRSSYENSPFDKKRGSVNGDGRKNTGTRGYRPRCPSRGRKSSAHRPTPVRRRSFAGRVRPSTAHKTSCAPLRVISAFAHSHAATFQVPATYSRYPRISR